MFYRLAAIPTGFAGSDDVIVEDQNGAFALFNRDRRTLTPLSHDEATFLMSFFEPSQDYTWRTEATIVEVLSRDKPAPVRSSPARVPATR